MFSINLSKPPTKNSNLIQLSMRKSQIGAVNSKTSSYNMLMKMIRKRKSRT